MKVNYSPLYTKTNFLPFFAGNFRRILGIFFCLSFVLSGCSSLKIYDANRDQLATTAKEKYEKEINLPALFEQEHKNLDTLLKQEARIVTEAIAVERDIALWNLLAKDDCPLKTHFLKLGGCLSESAPSFAAEMVGVQARLNALGVSDRKNLQKAVLAYNVFARDGLVISEGLFNVEEARSILVGTFGYQPPKCLKDGNLEPDALEKHFLEVKNVSDGEEPPFPEGLGSKDLTLALEMYIDTCNEHKADLDKIKFIDFPAGEIQSAAKKWENARKEVAEIDEAKKKIKASLKKIPLGTADTRESLAARISSNVELFNSLINNIQTTADALGFEEALTALRLDAVSTLIQSATTGQVKTNDPDLKEAALIAAAIHDLAPKVDAVIKAIAGPEVKASLRLEAQLLQTRLGYLNSRTQLVRTRLAASRSLLLGRLREAWHIYNAQAWLEKAGLNNTQTLKAVLSNSSLPVEQRRAVWQAIVEYEQSYSQGRTQADVAAWQLIHTRHADALLSEEYAALAWNDLVSGSLEILEAYQKSGIKPEQISQLFIQLAQLGILTGILIED